jgi:hypothetical protein
MRYVRLALATVLIPVSAWFLWASLPYARGYTSYCSSGAIQRYSQATLPRLVERNREIMQRACALDLHHLIGYSVTGVLVAVGVFFLLWRRVRPSVDTASALVGSPLVGSH